MNREQVLEAALLRYGKHEQFCKCWHENRAYGTRWTVDEECDCGLTAAVEPMNDGEVK